MTTRDTAAMRFDKVDVRYLGGVTLLASILLIIFSAATGRGTDWWAAWGQWVGGIGSIAAAVAAVWIAVEGWRRSDAQAREQAKRLEENQQRDLASKFGMWLVRDNLLKPKIMVANSGPLPIYQVQLVFDFPRPEVDVADWDKLGGRRKAVYQVDTQSPITEPYIHAQATKHLWEYLTHQVEEHLHQSVYTTVNEPGARPTLTRDAAHDLRNIVPFGTIEVHFFDSNGLRWTRTHDGQLKPFTGWN